jgi:hypothetical protein
VATLMQKFIYERIREAFSAYVPDGMQEKYQAFQELYPAEQRKLLHSLYCAEVDNLILKMLRSSDELCKAVFADASDLLQCLVASRYTATLKYFMHTKDKALSKEFGPDEILAACLLTLWYNRLQDQNFDDWSGN